MKLIVVLSILFTIASAKVLADSNLSQFLATLRKLAPKIGAADDKVKNGKLATPGQFPWHLFIVVNSARWCGGSLIKPNWILTVQNY